jgi:glycosyltransferase involved in cell wall biosynthesis
VIEHPGECNRGTGPSRSLRLGLHHARGRHLAFLDADDAYEPQRLERAVELLETDSGSRIVVNRGLYWRKRAHEPRCVAELARTPNEVSGPAAYCDEVIPPRVLIVRALAVRAAPISAECGVDEPVLNNAMADELAEQPYNAAVVSEKTKLGLRRAALFAANGILPRKTADWLIHRYLERKSDATAKNAMRMAATLQMRPGSVGRR